MHSKLWASYQYWILIAMVGLLVFRGWIWPLGSSFWLDETFVGAMIHAPLREILPRTLPWPHSALFNFIEWFASHSLPGPIEIRLRIVSVLASALATVAVFRIGSKFVDRKAGFMSALFFMTLPQVCEQACNARPYALAVCAQVWGLYFLLEAIETGRSRSTLLWAAFSAAAIYLHVFFALSFAVEVVFVVSACLHRHRVELLRNFLIAVFLTLGALTPLASHALLLWRERIFFSFTWPLTAMGFVLQIVPFTLVPALLIIILECWCGKLNEIGNRQALWLFAAMLVWPVIVFFGLSIILGHNVFQLHHLAITFPACALFWGILASHLPTKGQQYLAAVLALVASYAVLGISGQQPSGANENWRSAGQQIPQNSSVLLYNGLTETGQLDWLADPSRWEFFSAPLHVYRGDMVPNQVLLLPFSCDAASRLYVNARLDQLLRRHRTVALEVRGNFGSDQWISVLKGSLTERGLALTRASQHGMVKLLIFQPIRNAPA